MVSLSVISMSAPPSVVLTPAPFVGAGGAFFPNRVAKSGSSTGRSGIGVSLGRSLPSAAVRRDPHPSKKKSFPFIVDKISFHQAHSCSVSTFKGRWTNPGTLLAPLGEQIPVSAGALEAGEPFLSAAVATRKVDIPPLESLLLLLARDRGDASARDVR